MSTSSTPKMTSSPKQSANGSSEFFNHAAASAASSAREAGNHYVAEPAHDVVGLLSDYARRKPDVAALWCFGVGVLIGWRLRG